MESGGQPGNQNAKKAKKWQEALARALARAVGTVDSGLDKVADQVVAQAMAGEKDAWQEIGNRFDGKPAQAITGGDDDDSPVSIRIIERVIVRPKASDTNG